MQENGEEEEEGREEEEEEEGENEKKMEVQEVGQESRRNKGWDCYLSPLWSDHIQVAGYFTLV